MIPLSRPVMDQKEMEAVAEVISSGWLAAGAKVAAFEEEFARYVGSKYTVATSNGTTALHTALLAASVGPGDRVVTTAFTFAATANAILMCGATPVFVDIDEDTMNISPEKIAEVIKREKIKAVVIVHLYGLPCDMDEITAILDGKEIILIEDCAQAHGAEFKGKKVGTFGLAAAFSFYATKNMTTGEGGMLITDDPHIARRARALVNHGCRRKYEHMMLGYNYRLTDIAAALGLVQLGKLPGFNLARQRNAAFLTAALQGVPWLRLPASPAGCSPVFHQYTVRVDHRDEFAAHLATNGVGFGIFYPLPLYRQPFYRRLGYGDLCLPRTKQASEKVLSLPVHPGLSPEDLLRITEVVTAYSP